MGSEDEKKMSSFSRWMRFFAERAPLVLFAFISLGPIMSSQYIVNGSLDVVRLVVGAFGFMSTLLLVRVMDDVKDYDTDVEVHPDRPLPRGLLTVKEVVDAIKITTAAMFGFAGLLAVVYGTVAGGSFLVVVVFIVMMYFEFGCGEWLDQQPLLYGLSHQFCIVFAAVFACVLAGDMDAPWKARTYYFGCMGLSGFFTYEVCRKLDPLLPKKKGTYLVVYGRWNVFAIVSATILMGVVCGIQLSLTKLLLPLQVIMIASLFVLFAFFPMSRKFKVVEGISVIYFLVHVWAGALYHWFLA